MPPRLYADNAATSCPKPPDVFEAMRAYAHDLGVSAGRGAYREAIEAGEILAACRRHLARLIGAEAPETVVFALNGSAALNQAIKGVLGDGDHVVTTTLEHNSVLRPLNALCQRGMIEVTHAHANAETGKIDADRIFDAVRPNTRLIAVIHASNVTGALQPVEEITDEARRRGIGTLVDAAQTAGHLPIDVQTMKIDLLAIPGHKGLLGPLGTGALYIRPGLEDAIRPLIEGGTGSVSERPVQPDFSPDKFESGSHNLIGLAGLAAALAWIESKTVAALVAHERELSARFLKATADVEGLTVYGPPEPDQRVAVFSVRIDGLEPSELSALLETEFGILTRSGMHCAPLAHQTIRTYDAGGTTRLSFGAFNTPKDMDRCADALLKLSAAGATGAA